MNELIEQTDAQQRTDVHAFPIQQFPQTGHLPKAEQAAALLQVSAEESTDG